MHEAHVEYIANLLRKIYSSPVFGYLEFTAAQRMLSTLDSPELLQKQIEATPYPKDFCKSLLSRDFIELQDLIDWTAFAKEDAQSILSLFVRKHAFIRATTHAYRKSAMFIELLKRLVDGDELGDRPSHIEERF